MSHCEDFGARLRAARLKAGYKRTSDFTPLIGIPNARYRAWERGEAYPHILALIELSHKLEVTLHEFFPDSYEGKKKKR